MTAILGIKTNDGAEEGVILASDTQLNFYEGDIHTKKKEMFKLFTDRQEKSWAIAFSGISDKYLHSFFSYLQKHRTFEGYLKFNSRKKNEESFSLTESVAVVPKEVLKQVTSILRDQAPSSVLEEELLKYQSGEVKPKTEVDRFLYGIFKKLSDINDDPVQEAIRAKHFNEFALHNRFYTQRYMFSGDEEDDELSTPQLILASNKPRIDLYQVDVAGNLAGVPSSKELEYICLGSGSPQVEAYFDEAKYEKDPNIPKSAVVNSKISLDQIDLRTAYWLAYGAITDAIIQDPNTGGLVDMVIVTKEKVTHLGPEVQEEITSGVRSIYERMSKVMLPTHRGTESKGPL
tara:strand:- start:369 stop:1406 length:1038 start_codon:yes stop_codon:yes gene_type:complete